MLDQSFKMMIVAGGTGGHIIPAQTMARYCQQRGHTVVCVGTAGDLEQQLLSEFDLHTLSVSGLRGKSKWAMITGMLKMLRAVFQSMQLLHQQKPNVVLCMGGYVTVPVALAAKILGIPIVLHEQNSIAGKSNQYLAKIATTVLTSFAGAFPDSVDAQLVGNPLRSAIARMQPNEVDDVTIRKLRILVLGGSQGAQALNSCCMQVFVQSEVVGDCDVWHQSGARDHQRVADFYANHQASLKHSAFIDDMVSAYQWADVVISRSGALSVAELTAAGLPVLFVPFPFAVDDHQYKNAMALVTAGAAVICRENELSEKVLIDYLLAWQQNPRSLKLMAEAAAALAIRDADVKIYDACIAAAK